MKNQIKIVMLTPFETFSKQREFKMQFKNGETFRDLVNNLIMKFGESFKSALLDESSKIKDSVMVLKDGANISAKDDSGYSLRLENGQEYVFCAVVSGG